MATGYRIKLHSPQPGAASDGKSERSYGHHHLDPAHVHAPGSADEAEQKVAGRCHVPSRRLRMHCEHLSCADPSRDFLGRLQLYVLGVSLVHGVMAN